MVDGLERMRALVAQAVAEARYDANGSRNGSLKLAEVQLVVYGDHDEREAYALFEEASRGTEAEGARLVVERAGSRYICWNCCGLRFESRDGLCPNCGEIAMEIPEDVPFGLRRAVAE